MSGHWQRASCSCTSSATALCDDIWQNDYPSVVNQAPSFLAGTTYTSNRTSALKSLEFTYTNPEWTVNTFPLPPAVTGPTWLCHGWMGKQIVCETPDQATQFCTVQFDCVSGDCVTTVVQGNMRSMMFPILGGILGIVWLLLSFLKGLPLPMIAMILAVVIFVLSLFLLVGPLVFPGLMAMAFAAVAFSANKGEGHWELKLAIVAGIFVFLSFAGLNSLAGTTQNYFDAVTAGFNNYNCVRYYGLEVSSPRCAQYLLFVGFDGFLIMMLVPLLVIVLIGRLSDGKE